MFDLTVDDAIERALDRNLDIAVERLNPQLQDLSIAEANAAFAPNLSSNFDLGRSVTPSRSQLDGRLSQLPVNTETGAAGVGIEQATRWYGGRYTLNWDNGRTETNNVFFSYNPSFRSFVALGYTQPLLRGRRIDAPRRQLLVSQLNRDISDIDLRETVTNTVAEVRRAYWELVYAKASVDVQLQALELAEQLVRDNRARVEIGTLAPIDIVQAQSEAAQRRQAVAEAEQNLRTAELLLKQLIVGGTDDEVWDAGINTVEQPVLDLGPVDVDRANPDGAGCPHRYRAHPPPAGDQRRHPAQSPERHPAVARPGRVVSTAGPGRHAAHPAGHRRSPAPRRSHDRQRFRVDTRDALAHLAGIDFPDWTVQLQLSYPLGQSAQRAAHARAQLQVRQTRAQLRQLELQVATEVTNAAVLIQSVQQRIDAARAARELAEEQLAAEESKFEVGTSNQFLRRAGPARPGDRPRQRAAGHPRLPECRHRVRAGAADVAGPGRDLDHPVGAR